MNITLIDSAASMRRILDAPVPDRADLVRDLWEPMAGMYRFVPGGLDIFDAHALNFGFPVEASGTVEQQVREGLDALVAADAWTRIEGALARGITELTAANPDLVVPDLRVLLMLGDPTNAHFTDQVQGLSAFGGISGYITITVWPTPRVLERLEAIAVHELHHNLRYLPGGVVWDPATVTVGEHIVAEGLADVFSAELYGTNGYTHFAHESAWNDDAVLAKVATGLGVTGMDEFTSWVLGDASAELFGGRPVGLPTGAGYAAGARIVHAYLDAAGGTSAQNLRTPVADILATALPRLGLAAHTAE